MITEITCNYEPTIICVLTGTVYWPLGREPELVSNSCGKFSVPLWSCLRMLCFFSIESTMEVDCYCTVGVYHGALPSLFCLMLFCIRLVTTLVWRQNISGFWVKPVEWLVVQQTAAMSICNWLFQLFCPFLIVHQIICNSVLFNLSTWPLALGW